MAVIHEAKDLFERFSRFDPEVFNDPDILLKIDALIRKSRLKYSDALKAMGTDVNGFEDAWYNYSSFRGAEIIPKNSEASAWELALLMQHVRYLALLERDNDISYGDTNFDRLAVGSPQRLKEYAQKHDLDIDKIVYFIGLTDEERAIWFPNSPVLNPVGTIKATEASEPSYAHKVSVAVRGLRQAWDCKDRDPRHARHLIRDMVVFAVDHQGIQLPAILEEADFTTERYEQLLEGIELERT